MVLETLKATCGLIYESNVIAVLNIKIITIWSNDERNPDKEARTSSKNIIINRRAVKSAINGIINIFFRNDRIINARPCWQ